MDDLKLYEYDYDKPELTEMFLAHHGVKEQRWGVKHGPPYPLDSDVSTGNRLKKTVIGSSDKPKSKHQLRVEARKKKKLNKKRVETLKKARAMKTQKDAKKKEILSSNDVSKIYENRDLFSKGEIDKFVEKYNSDQSLRRLVEQEKAAKSQKAFQKIQNIQRYAETSARLATNLVSFYDTYTNITNKIDQQNRAQEKEKVQNFKKKIVDTRDLQKAYDNRTMFNNKELENLMATVDTDTKLKKKIDKMNSERAQEAKSAPKTSINGAAKRQVEKFNKQDAKLAKLADKRSKFKDREDFERWKDHVDKKVNHEYYFGNHDEDHSYRKVTDDEVIKAKRDYELSTLKAKRAADEKKKGSFLTRKFKR